MIKILTVIALIFKTILVCGQFESNYFYIEKVNLVRPQKYDHLGWIFTESNTNKRTFVVENGLERWLQKKLTTNYNYAKTKNPYFVFQNVTHLDFAEKAVTENNITGIFTYSGNFYILENQDSTIIFPFKYTVKYRRKPSNITALYNLIDNKINDLHKKLETWFDKNYGQNPKLARYVKVKTSDFYAKYDGDTLYYPDRKLQVSDFSPRTNIGKNYALMVFTNLGYQANVTMKSDTVFIDLAVKVYQIKRMSFIADYSSLDQSMAHEQLHFDITQLIAEKFKARLQEEVLPANDYDSRLQYLYLEYYRQINKMQDAYDAATRHGLDKAEQENWRIKISDELKRYKTL